MVLICFFSCLYGILSLKTDSFSEKKESLIGLNWQVIEGGGVDKKMEKKDTEWVAFADVIKQSL